ncbi:putative cell wall binding repeat 2-containing protein [Methanocaldococcus sp. FS406-22]|uniref:cell wall-binding repeat-containing protein n=1 Tax=Methanocaldococcus sp. (strain FS406-22) TaxID=644281 RepID=UPI0001BF5038|nr:cell wall-binding repeat-containing protein [Methanocaldococcus sp. FS406-22]ADC70100.1 putative cell wall binding repeat 2-containing protein [Methanocaldococcus sp. FS406-22]
MWKKLLLLLLMAIPMVSANFATDVVLVSDNCADQCCALEVANALNATVITTEWGIYNESVVNEILALNPTKVIIIGGPLAVVENYTTALENAGITVERIGGKTRYETNANVTLRFQNQFRYAYGNNTTACVCYGFDDIALNETMELIKNGTCLVLLTNGVNLTVEPQKLQLKINKVEIVENPICPFCNYSKLMLKLQKNGLKIEIKQIPKVKVKLMLQHRIKMMERRIFMLKRMGVNVTDLEEKLKEVEELIKQNRYQDAYRIMVQLQGEQMAMVKLHLHPGGHGMAKGRINAMIANASHVYHQNANTSKIGIGGVNAPHIYHQNINNTQIDVGKANISYVHNK